jgi:hypothetical protein
LRSGTAVIATSSICRIDAICIISATAQSLPVANRAKPKVNTAGCKNPTTNYYSDKTAARLLSLNEAELREARRSLLAAGLIAYESPLYQVLSLEPTLAGEQPVARTGRTVPISANLRQILEPAGTQQP